MLVPAHLDPFFDSIVGNLFSQFSVAATAVLVAVFDLKYYWWFIFAGIYAFIEETFLVLGIYSQNWYQTWMTIILFPMLFWLTKYLYARIIQDPKPLLYYIYTFFALLPIAYYPTIWGFQVAQILDYNETLLANPEISQSIIRYLIFLVVAATMMCVYFLKVNRYWKAFITALLYAAFYMAFKLDLIFVKAGWFIPASTIIIVWMYLSVIILDKLYGGLSMRSGARSG
ncbi:MAG: hypothetical protein PHD36_06650 [Desulfotomaculaceae bacterium]|nr:hypothetical protein [Desulfotomaculaceae bacterium]